MFMSEENIAKEMKQRTLEWLCKEICKHGFGQTIYHDNL